MSTIKLMLMLSSCHVLLFVCLYPGFFNPPYLFLPPPPTLSPCMLVFSLSSSSVTMQPETLSKPPVRECWTSGCCLVPTHVYPDFGAKSLCDFLLDAKAFCSACHNQFRHYYKVKHQSPTSKGFLLASFSSLWFIVDANYETV